MRTMWDGPRGGYRRARTWRIGGAVAGRKGSSRWLAGAGAFSLGMGQRLGIAAAPLGDPQTVMLDEPVNGLDPEGVLWIRNLLTDLAAAGRTIFVSSHLMSEMALVADHLIVLTPAITGVNVRTIGTKRASTIERPPCFSKNSCACSTYSRLNSRESGRRNSATVISHCRPTPPSEVVRTGGISRRRRRLES